MKTQHPDCLWILHCPAMRCKPALILALVAMSVISLAGTPGTSGFSAAVDVRGKVTSMKSSEPLAGVSVVEQGTTNGTVTDVNGDYSLKVSQGSLLVFSFIGYITKEVRVENQSVIDLVLEESVQNLDQLVVIGYGTQKSSQITSAIAKITADDLDERPTSRVDHALAGKLAGVQVQEVSGRPGRPLTVNVRGVGSISSSNSPLYVIDGYPINSGLDNINPNDIESIEVLKDAAAAAIYGSRGSNGVVLITTKFGKSGKPTLQFDSYFAMQERFSKVDVLNRDEYIEFAIEERNNSWELLGGRATDPNSARNNAAYWIDPLWITNPASFPDHDWQELITRKNAPVQNYQLSASGTNENVRYYISGNYFNQKGIILGSGYDRLAFRANVESRLGKRVNIGLNLSATVQKDKDPVGDNEQGPVSTSIRSAPIWGLNEMTQEGGFYMYGAGFLLNPIALATQRTNKGTAKNIRANLYASIDIAKNLVWRSSFGTDQNSDLTESFLPDNINRGRGHVATAATGNRENFLTENTLSYDLQDGRFSVNAVGGFTYQQDYNLATSLGKTGFPDAEITTLNIGTVLSSGSSSATQWTLMSFLGRVSSAWDDKYLFAASIRRDGSSRFGADNRWGWFPAVSLGWRLSGEKFMENVRHITELKLRASYGITGNNNIGDYAAIGNLGGANYPLGTAQTVVSGFAPASFSNRALGWERTGTFDAGIDVGLISNRIRLGLDYYLADTKDLLLSVPIPAISGFSTSLQNIGAVRNTGIELELKTHNLTGKLKWSTSFNIAHNKNKVLALGPGDAPIYGSAAGFDVTKTEVGAPIGNYFLFVQEGVFMNQQELDSHPHYKVQNIGDIKYKDVNGDGVIDLDDRTTVGNNRPKFFWGLENSFAFGNFDLSISMDGQWGNKLLNLALKEDGQSRGNVYGYWRNRWRSPEDPGDGWTPRAAVTANLATPSTFWLRNASYFRIRTASLGYRIPDTFIDKVHGFSGLRLYFSIDNIYMHDHNDRSPQTGAYSNSNTVPGVMYISTYPLARSYTLGLNVKF